ncbi:hypothetical protein L3556_05525 [Candidatus Synechococcus calcipolaris G9]|uniref:Transposase n=1 Tax=Candidatus Synechococcus calcipolaris G9 TaxID=1497997 RepID=A0ABT6EZ07_9SYNE|nr:hypothetical protein [Candidatus Synechococcus calcipolaris]MDG2990395.1 hypothetical protein [Candidatus Synechococcus calcipolaris G9]
MTESALRQWVKQATIDQSGGNQGSLTTQELTALRKDLKRVEMERDFLKKPQPSLHGRATTL